MAGSEFHHTAVLMRRCTQIITLAVALLVAGYCQAAPDVVVNGLFKNKAMLTIEGRSHLLKVGNTVADVTLVSSDSKQAVVIIDGERQTLQVSQRIAAQFSEAKMLEVKLPRGVNGHYYARGAINGYPADFVVDTGASAVAMNKKDAQRLGVDIAKGVESMATTAGGVVNTYVVQLDKISVGSITLYDITATVIDGDFPVQILLGNTFLGRVALSEQDGVLTLRQKFQ